jgi:hypothetical protein
MIFQATYTKIIPPAKTTHKGKLNPKSNIVDISPVITNLFCGYNNCVLSK